MQTFDEMRHYLRQFARDRDWQQFHAPKNLVMALSVETGELMEHFQWLTEAQSEQLSPEAKQAVADEIADVQLYLVLLADRLGIDLPAAIERKTRLNEAKYPADQVRGSAKKYDRY